MPMLPEPPVRLRALQETMLRGLLDAEGDAAALIVERGLAPEERLRIYAVTARENIESSLRLGFPAIVRLVGDDYFNQCVHGYRRHRPSRSGDLQDVGDGFADYLGQLHASDQYAYLADVARLEWLHQLALTAPEHPPLDVSRLATVPAERYEELRFLLHPAVRLLRSGYPVLRIWQANSGETASDEAIDLASGDDRVLIARPHGRVECRRVEAGEYRFLEALRCESTFAAAVDAACDCDPQFDATAALSRSVAAAVIVDFRC